MAAVAIQSVTRQFGAQVVLENVSLELRTGETVGLVGANGAGKTTLFRLITGELPPDRGTVVRSRDLEIGFLRQEPDVSLERTLHDEVGSAFADLLVLEDRLYRASEEIAARAEDSVLPDVMQRYERLNAKFIAAGGHTFEARLNEILGGLGFSPGDYSRPMSKMSGGQKCRAALAKVLLQGRSFLLLDEPTNHLDIDAVRWLEKFLIGHHGGAVVVSHDRYLLDRLCDRIVEVDRRRIAGFAGNYTNYVKTKEIRILTQQREYEKGVEFIEKERAFIAKHIARQRSKEARGRRTRLERRLKAGEFVTERPTAKRTAKIAFRKTESREGTVLRCDDLCMSYGENVLFTDLALQVRTGERFGITGPNGTGKTTLFKIILGQVAATGGEFTLDSRLTIGYYAQEDVDLDAGRTVVDEVLAARPGMTEQDARSYLGRYLFSGEDAFKTLGMLSGGEQSRLRLATLILKEPELLILDEPTNHLDIPSREALEEALYGFGGTIIVVSHDRYFLDRMADRLLVIRRGGHAVYDGNYSYYIEQVEQEKAGARAKTTTPRRKGKARDAAGDRKKAQPSPYDRLSIDELEDMVIEREAKLAELHERFADSAVYKDPDALADLRDEVEALEHELAEVDAAWQERAELQ